MSSSFDLFGDAEPPPPSAPRPRGPKVVAEAVPLAERLRPQTLDDVIGQQHLLGP
ncbi:MAG TPA: recombination factor protein RarA, partial [Burkholderiaceae bacterium]|nr:recombination factor protein RarA [Burkholderiaceae bacterium]